MMQFKSYLLMLFLLLGAVLTVQSCVKDKVEPMTPPSGGNPSGPDNCPDTISFSEFVKPFVDMNCAFSGCHGGGSTSGGYAFNNHAEISGSAAIMLQTIRHESGVDPMPQGSAKLADSLINQFNCWIEQGKLNN